jgi:hypothetical protein
MPDVPDVRVTSHDRHDPMLVAALAAGDLAGTDRDQAIALTRTCADCASLHDDLLAIRLATASVPPPFAAGGRDFRLTPDDAARLRRTGWRRLVGPVATLRTGLGRPVGIGLATLGLVGLLVGNIQLGSPSSRSAAAPAAGSAVGDSAAGQPSKAGPADGLVSLGGAESLASAAASAAPVASDVPVALVPAASAATAASMRVGPTVTASGSGSSNASPGDVAIRGAAGQSSPSDSPVEQVDTEPVSPQAVQTSAMDPLRIASITAIIIGLGAIVVSRRRGSRAG